MEFMVFNTIFNRGKYENHKFGHNEDMYLHMCIHINIYIYEKNIEGYLRRNASLALGQNSIHNFSSSPLEY